MPISSSFSKLLLTLLQNNKIDNTLYDKISDKEKNIFELLISNTTINKINHIRYDQSEIDELVDRYNILKGELIIGNDNPQLLKDLKIVILRLVNHNILKLKEIIPILEYLFLLI
jgi:hypothetical protein